MSNEDQSPEDQQPELRRNEAQRSTSGRSPFTHIADMLRHAEHIRDQIENSSFIQVSRQISDQLTMYQSFIENSPVIQMGDYISDEMRKHLTLINSISATLRPEWLVAAQNNYNVFQDNWTAVSNSINDIVNSPAIQSVQQLMETYRSLQTAPLGAVFAEAHTRWLRDIEFLTPALSAISAGLAHALESPEYRSHFEQSFAGDLLGQINAVDVASSPEEKAARFSALVVWFQQKLREYPPSHIIFHAFFSLILPIILAQMVSEWRSAQAEQQQSAEMRRHIDQQVESLRDDLEAHHPSVEGNAEQRQHYSATKSVYIRAEPLARGTVVIVLEEHSLIEEVDRQGRWLYVEYFNFIEGSLERGWVYKRYLTPVAPLDDE